MGFAIGKSKQSQDGFTFVELVVAVTILGILMTLGVISYRRFADTAKKTTAKTNLKSIQSGINLFYIELSRYPSKLQDLVERPQGDLGKDWHAYLDKLPKDPWKFDFYYKVNQPGSKRPYELYSYGSDQGPETPPEERISVWD